MTPDQVLALLAAGPDRIAEVTRGATGDRLRLNPAPGEWAANDVLAHLRSCADVWGGCIGTILAEDHPTIRAVNPRTWIDRTDYLDLGFRRSLRSFTKQRQALVAALQPLSAEEWARAATVTGAGRTLERTVLSYAEWLATHERPHLTQIARAVTAVRPA